MLYLQIQYLTYVYECKRGFVSDRLPVSSIFQTLTYIFGDMLNSVGAAGKVFEYLDRRPLVSTDGSLRPDELRGHISFRSLSFSYPTNPTKTVLQVRLQDRWVWGLLCVTATDVMHHCFRTSPWS